MSQPAAEIILPALPQDFPEYDTEVATKVWDALINPAHDAEPLEVESFSGYNGMDDAAEFDMVAQRMAERHDLFPDLTHSILSTVEGAVDAFEIGVHHDSTGTYLMRYVERKHATYQRSATGAAAALSYGLVIADYYGIQHALMARLDA